VEAGLKPGHQTEPSTTVPGSRGASCTPSGFLSLPRGPARSRKWKICRTVPRPNIA